MFISVHVLQWKSVEKGGRHPCTLSPGSGSESKDSAITRTQLGFPVEKPEEVQKFDFGVLGESES